jgi:hypothetical protein
LKVLAGSAPSVARWHLVIAPFVYTQWVRASVDTPPLDIWPDCGIGTPVGAANRPLWHKRTLPAHGGRLKTNNYTPISALICCAASTLLEQFCGLLVMPYVVLRIKSVAMVSLGIAFANSRMAPQKRSVSKKKFSATTSVGAAASIGR